MSGNTASSDMCKISPKVNPHKMELGYFTLLFVEKVEAKKKTITPT
jgi:hypothetical protein